MRVFQRSTVAPLALALMVALLAACNADKAGADKAGAADAKAGAAATATPGDKDAVPGLPKRCQVRSVRPYTA